MSNAVKGLPVHHDAYFPLDNSKRIAAYHDPKEGRKRNLVANAVLGRLVHFAIPLALHGIPVENGVSSAIEMIRKEPSLVWNGKYRHDISRTAKDINDLPILIKEVGFREMGWADFIHEWRSKNGFALYGLGGLVLSAIGAANSLCNIFFNMHINGAVYLLYSGVFLLLLAIASTYSAFQKKYESTKNEIEGITISLLGSGEIRRFASEIIEETVAGLMPHLEHHSD